MGNRGSSPLRGATCFEYGERLEWHIRFSQHCRFPRSSATGLLVRSDFNRSVIAARGTLPVIDWSEIRIRFRPISQEQLPPSFDAAVAS